MLAAEVADDSIQGAEHSPQAATDSISKAAFARDAACHNTVGLEQATTASKSNIEADVVASTAAVDPREDVEHTRWTSKHML